MVENGASAAEGNTHSRLPKRSFRGRLTLLVRPLDEIAGFSLAALALFFFAPLMGFIALAVCLESPGPVFFKQKRQGCRHREIEVFTFRTLRQNGIDDGHDQQMRPGKPGTTRIGGFLRNSSLDNLPQLLNVARSGMPLSLYGCWLNGNFEPGLMGSA